MSQGISQQRLVKIIERALAATAVIEPGFAVLSRLKKAAVEEFEEEAVSCSECKRKFRNAQGLRLHRWKSHER
jgi:hypothetical protein